MVCSSGLFVVSSEAAPGGDAPDEVYYCGYAHGEAYDVVPEAEVWDFDGCELFDGACEECCDEQDDEEPCVGMEPCFLFSDGAEHFSELGPVDAEEYGHGVADDPVGGL